MSGATGHADCDLCGAPAVLVDGVCDACARHMTPPSCLITRDRLLEVLSRHIGAGTGVSIDRLVAEMIAPHRSVLGEFNGQFARAVRQLVVEQRLEGHHICAHPTRGYYLAATADELDSACQFLYDRAMTSLRQVAAMKRIALPDLRGQFHLPT